MRLFGLEIKRVPASPVDSNRGGWWPIIREPYPGAWQRDIEWTVDTVAAHHAVYACITLIANDVGKLRPKLVQLDANGIWTETQNAAFSPVLRKPNPFQNRIQFLEWWVTSKLMRGNAYALKQRDASGIVRRLYLLDPTRVTPMVTPTGDVFYDLKTDNLAGIRMDGGIQVPAREIIHDRMNCLFHPLVGVSPLYSAGPAATVGQRIQANAERFFANGSNPSGLLTTVESLPPAKAKELSDQWNSQFTGDMSGKVAVLGFGMKFEPMRMTAVDSQLIEQAKHTAETVCAAFHVPPWKVHVGQQPAYTKPEIANQAYYADCLQSHIEQWELCMDEGLGLTEAKDGRVLGVELDLDGLLRMDTASQVETLAAAVGGSIMVPNEARARLSLPPKKGGDQIWMQQQNYSLEALAERDKNGPPPNSVGDRRQTPPPTPPEPPKPDPEDEDEEDVPDDEARALLDLYEKAIAA